MKKIFVVAALIISSPLLAQEDTSARALDDVIITATKTPVKQSQTGKVITVIDQATLQRNLGKTLSEILNYQAGIFINGANNVLGTNQDIYFRGAATGNVLILMDGIPVMDPSQINNTFDLNSINPYSIERIEILKGAQSTLWGSDAVAGVINIITKKGGGKKISPNAALSYGSYQTFRGSAGINGTLNGLDYNLHYSRTRSKGFSSAQDTLGNKGFDKDGFTQNNFQANVGYRFSSPLSVKGLAQIGNYTTDIDAGAFTDDKDYNSKSKQQLYSLDAELTVAKLKLHFVPSYLQTKRELTDDSLSVGGFAKYAHGFYHARSVTSELFGTYSFSSKASLTAGAQSLWQNTDQGYLSISSFGPFKTALGRDSARINNQSLYASFLLTSVGHFNSEAGVRYNNHSIYGNNATYTFNPSYNIDANTRVFLNISSAYKIPSLYQLYSEYGNKDLSPEKSKNYELGIQVFSNEKHNSFRILGFKRDSKNLILFYTNPATYASFYINRDEQHDYGFELESTVGFGTKGGWSNNLTYIDGEGKNGNIKVKNLYRRPNFTLNSVLTLMPVKNLTLMPSFRFVGTRLKGQYDAGPALMPAYYTLDFYAGYMIKKEIRLFADFRNITDQRYFDIAGYNSRRFNAVAGISASF